MLRIATFFLLWILTGQALATHILGGYIQARRVSPTALTYDFTVTLFTNENQASTQQTSVDFCFGDGSAVVKVPLSAQQPLGSTILRNTYQTTYTYSAPATHTVSISITNRSDGLRNFASSVNTPYYLETTLSTALPNTTPAFAMPENLFQVATGQPAVLNLFTADAEGDSITYSLAPAKVGSCGQPSASAAGYTFPNDVTRQGTYRIDARRGELSWNAPTEQGQYVFVVRAEEWRNGQKISETYLDMILTVRDRPGTTPVPIPPYEAAVGSNLVTSLTGEAGDGEVSILAYPVPVQSQLLVRVRSAQPVTAKMQVFNAQGQLLREVELPTPAAEHEVTFDATNWAAGSYLVRTYTLGKAYTNKIMKQ